MDMMRSYFGYENKNPQAGTALEDPSRIYSANDRLSKFLSESPRTKTSTKRRLVTAIGIGSSAETTQSALLDPPLKVIVSIQVRHADFAEEMLSRGPSRIKIGCAFFAPFFAQAKKGIAGRSKERKACCTGKE